MNVCGVICEYNPFHNGHLFHLAQARRQSGADYVVCVMSGDVTQRGTFARHDKFLRTRMALQGGADLVLQLPTRFSCAAADEFAAGGVALLSALGVVTHLSFGCEPETLPVLLPAARALRAETPAFRDALASALQSGIPYPAAYAKAAEDTLAPDGTAELLSQPNAALALQYLRVLPPDITPVPVARTGRRHDEPGLHPLAGASAIRRALEDGLPASDIAPSLPFSRAVAEAEQRGFVLPENALELPALWRLRSLSAAELARLAGVSEGLENRIAQAARQAGDRETWLSLCKTRRYTRARLSRIFICALLGLTQPLASAHPSPEYARILGFRQSARPLLGAIGRRTCVPLVAKCADFDRANPLFALDVRARDLWALGCENPAARAAGSDFTTSPVMLEGTA